MQQAKKKPGAQWHSGKSSYNPNHNPAGPAPASQGRRVQLRPTARRQWQGRGR